MGMFGVKIKWMLLLAICYLINNSISTPVDTQNSLVVGSAVSPDEEPGKEATNAVAAQTIQIYQMQVDAHISNRYAYTTVISKVKNYANVSKEATFSIVLPETAFIAGFVMEIDGKNYTAYVKEKEEAKKTYDAAVASGQSAAHVAVSARDSNRFTVSVNVEAETKAAFYLSYEELLKRQDNHYELVINIHPGQPVKDLSVKVEINESRKVVDLKVPPLRSGNDVGSSKEELDPRADIRVIDDNHAIVSFSPNLERQKQLARLLGTKEENGIAGQFVVQYDVERDPQGGEVLIQDGYFVHFFAPSDLQPLPKHVVFVLDTSGSMNGQKIVQLRESMDKILEQLNEQDKFNLIEFNSNVQVLDLEDPTKNVKYPKEYSYSSANGEQYPHLSTIVFPPPYEANADNIKKAKSSVSKLTPTGSTDIYTGLEVGLYQVELARVHNSTHQPLIIFLTDGEPNVRIRSTDEITTKIMELNSGQRKSPIFTLSFGDYANKGFLQKLAARNNGFTKHIYEAADASLQLQNFYKQVSSPLLSDVKFKYEPTITSLTVTEFPIHFGGSELVVAGCYITPEFIPPTIEGRGRIGRIILKPASVQRSVTSIERLWAYLTVKQLLEKKENTDKNVETIKKKALEVALKYQFVTSVSSLVVVKPNATSDVGTEAADKAHQPQLPNYPRYYQRMGHPNIMRIGGTSSSSFGLHGPPSLQSGYHAGSADTLALNTIIRSVPRPTGIHFETPTTAPDIFATLTWLKDIVTSGIITLSKGDFKLGLYETISDKVNCSNAPQNGTGHCTLLDSCRHVHHVLISQEVYERHFCALKNEYAGVCCPEVA